MASTAYPRIGGRGKSELHAVGVLRLSLCPGSSLISIPNSKIQTRRVLARQKEKIEFPSIPPCLGRGIQRKKKTGSVKTASDSFFELSTPEQTDLNAQNRG